MARLDSEMDVPRTHIFEVTIAIAPINYADSGIYKVKVLAGNRIVESLLTVRKIGATQT